jgi:hypothetical protein
MDIASISGVEAEINLKTCRGDMEPFDLGATIASGEITGAPRASKPPLLPSSHNDQESL